MYIKRTIEDRILNMAQHFPVVMVCGPRQIGKPRSFLTAVCAFSYH